MIKIKDLIINENEIVYIEEFAAQSLGIMFKGKDKATFVDAYIEDIEWNYGNTELEVKELKQYLIEQIGVNFRNEKTLKEMIDRLLVLYRKTAEDLNNEGKNHKETIEERDKLEEENKKLKFAMQDTYDSANNTCGELQLAKDKLLCDYQNAVDKIEELQDRINKALEYIGNGNLGINKKVRDRFIKILKGKE